jgi:hypothetical protein
MLSDGASDIVVQAGDTLLHAAHALRTHTTAFLPILRAKLPCVWAMRLPDVSARHTARAAASSSSRTENRFMALRNQLAENG